MSRSEYGNFYQAVYHHVLPLLKFLKSLLYTEFGAIHRGKDLVGIKTQTTTHQGV